MVDKTSCLVGEPILATFKLYSRLESKSDVVKNPGLYGFTVHDMVNLADREVVNEKINGKDFDVHTIRKVQLYPLQSGDFIVDPMEIKNRVEFSVSAVDKRTEQEVVEGILGNNDHDVHPPGTQIFETSVSTPEIKIHVSPLPEKNKPASYTGAVGSFRINARAVKPALLKNEEGFIEIIISGTGNFIQVDAPEIRWPTGLEGFQPKLRDQLDKMNIPLRGSRSFIYPFVALSAGNFTIPAVHFNFFDPDSNHYRQVQTDAVTINISNEAVIKEETIKDKKGRPGFYFIAAILLAGIGLSFILFKKYISSRKTSAEPAINQGEEPALDIAVDEPGFYSAVYHAVWQTAAKKFALQGSKMNKEILKLVMSANNVPPDTIDQLLEVIRQCEIGMFTGAVPDYQPSAILQNAREIIREIKSL
jgi:hypothetical protein